VDVYGGKKNKQRPLVAVQNINVFGVADFQKHSSF